VLFIIGEGDIIIKKVLVGAAVPPEKKDEARDAMLFHFLCS